MTFKFIDLFAGIGGMRMAFESIGGECVFTSEWDKYAAKTYKANHSGEVHGDIRSIGSSDIPDHHLLIAGFPCQPFSSAGVSKKSSMGKETGFLDETQGTLFFEVARIIRDKRPKVFLLENVKNLLRHDKGRTFKVIQRILEELGYTFSYRVINACPFVPQNRERVFILGFRDGEIFDWDSIPMPSTQPLLKSILHGAVGEPESDQERFVKGGVVDARYTMSERLWGSLQAHADRHKVKGQGFGYGLVTPESVTRTLMARYYKDGSEILLAQEGCPRRLTPRECARLMGFPDTFKIVCSDTQAYKQFGNSVVVPLISHIAQMLKPYLRTWKVNSASALTHESIRGIKGTPIMDAQDNVEVT